MMGLIRGSTLIRWRQAWSRRVPVVAVGRGMPVLDGEESGTPLGIGYLVRASGCDEGCVRDVRLDWSVFWWWCGVVDVP